MAKTKLSISLIRENIPLAGVVKPGVSSARLQNGHTIYYKSAPASEPKWVNSFFSGGIVDTTPFKTKSTSAVVLYEVEVRPGYKRIFAVTFGYGRNLLNAGVVEERFGLITTLNIVDYDQLRSVDVNSLESVPLNNRLQSSALAGIGNFNIDIDKDLLKSVTGRSSLQGFDGTLSGADSLSISTDKAYDTVDALLKDCFTKFESTNYQTYFDWVDQMKAIKDSALISALDNLLINEMGNANPSNVWMSIPEILDWNRTDMFKLSSDTLYDDIDIIKVKAELNNAIALIDLKTKRLSAVDEHGSKYKSWPLYKCIYADVIYNNKQYLLNEGKWYELADNFVSQVNDFYNNSVASSLALPDYSDREEKDYNVAIENSNNALYCLMDRKTVMIGGTPIEFCDIYTNHKQFVHVKKYSSSAVLSHLFFQGLVSAEAFFDKQFRLDVNAKLTRGFAVETCDTINAHDYEVVYVIAREGASHNQLPEMPFFSKVAFRNAAKRLKRYGYKVSITGVPYTYVQPVNP